MRVGRSLIGVLALASCAACAHRDPSAAGEMQPAMAAASGVARADGGKGPGDPRIIPLGPMSGDVEILYGDPETPDRPFVIRIHELPGAVVPPHSHPVDENITVIQGTWYFALGEAYDPAKLQELKTGGYAFAPRGSTMFGYSPDGAIVQVHGVGPFRIHWHGGLHALDDPDARRVFRYGRGNRLASPRGAGQVAQGYASGTIVQYELVAPNGEHFMADESALSPE